MSGKQPRKNQSHYNKSSGSNQPRRAGQSGQGRSNNQAGAESMLSNRLNGTAPEPSSAVSKLEQDAFKSEAPTSVPGTQLATAIGGLTIQESDLGMRASWPGYSQEGEKVKLWANYVELAPVEPEKMKLYWYSVSAKPKEDSEISSGKGKGKGKEREGEAEDDEDAKLAKGVKLGQIIAQLLEVNLEEHHVKGRLVSDFKATIISLDLLKESSYTVKYNHELNPEGTPAEEYIVTLKRAKAGDKKLKDGTKKTEIVTDQDMVQDVGELYNLLRSTDPKGRETAAVATKVEAFMQAFNIYLRHFSKLSKFGRPKQGRPVQAIAGSRAFPVPTDPAIIADSNFGFSVLRAMKGYFSSVRAAAGRLLVNVNVSCAAFYRHGIVTQLIREIQPGMDPNMLGDFDYEYYHRALKGVKVRVTFLTGSKAIKTIHGLAHKAVDGGWESKKTDDKNIAPRFAEAAPLLGASCGEVEFKKDNKWISVYNYLKTTYPTLTDLQPEDLVLNLSKDCPQYYPAKYCCILENQPCRQKLSPEETDKMIEKARMNPGPSMSSIVGTGLKTIGLTTGRQHPMRNFVPGTEMITVFGRQLDVPQVCYGWKGNRRDLGMIKPEFGAWNLRGDYEYSSPGSAVQNKIFNVGFIWPTDRPSDKDELRALEKAKRDLLRKIKDRGIKVGKLCSHESIKNDSDVVQQKMNERLGKGDDILVIFLPEKDWKNKEMYNMIKKQGDCRLGLLTICLMQDKVASKGQQYIENVVLKLNLKLRGVNQVLNNATNSTNGIDLLNEENKLMIVGYDVTHPSPGSVENAPSIAAMVANTDKSLGQWPASWKLQEANKEIEIDPSNLQDMMSDHLKRWFESPKHRNRLPENILVYRDGVSEGQYDQVIKHEYAALRDVCKEKYTKYKLRPPRITIVVVVKRHHTRFYATKDTAEERRNKLNGNPVPGTAVDCGVTSQFDWEFFLQSHKPLPGTGTARPAHYVVVVDEIFRNKYGNHQAAAEQLEKMTHALCYVFGRTTGAIGVAAPARLADLACDRARLYNEDLYLGREDGERIERVSEKVKDVMYYI